MKFLFIYLCVYFLYYIFIFVFYFIKLIHSDLFTYLFLLVMSSDNFECM